jgi:hypothetical protein
VALTVGVDRRQVGWGGALGVLLARKKGRGEKDLGRRRSMHFNGGGSSGEEQWGGAGVGVVPRGGGGRGGLVRCPDDAVARQRPDPSESGWAAHACMAGAKQGRPESPTSGLGATVTSGAGQKWFKPFQNSNGLKTFNFFQILIDRNLSFRSSKKLE